MTIRVNMVDYKILGVVRSSRTPVSTNKVAEKVGISWEKANKHLLILYSKGLVTPIMTSKKRYKWK